MKEKSTARGNPIIWWMCVLVRSAVSGEVDYISKGRFNRNPLPMDMDLAARVGAVIHYSKALVLDRAFWSWEDKFRKMQSAYAGGEHRKVRQSSMEVDAGAPGKKHARLSRWTKRHRIVGELYGIFTKCWKKRKR